MEISLYLAAIFVVFGLLFHGIGFRRGIKRGICVGMRQQREYYELSDQYKRHDPFEDEDQRWIDWMNDRV